MHFEYFFQHIFVITQYFSYLILEYTLMVSLLVITYMECGGIIAFVRKIRNAVLPQINDVSTEIQ